MAADGNVYLNAIHSSIAPPTSGPTTVIVQMFHK